MTKSTVSLPEKRIPIAINFDRISGFLLGFPFSFPAPPAYLLGFLIFGFSLFRRRTVDYPLLIKVGLLISIALATNIPVMMHSGISLARAVYTSFFFVLFLYGLFVSDSVAFIEGYNRMMNWLSVAVVVLFVTTNQLSYGVYLFINPTFRNWGSSFFPDWPNFFGFMIGIGFLLNILLKRPLYWTGITASALIMTTSRTPLIALVLGGGMLLQNLFKRRPLIFVYLSLFGTGILLLLLINLEFVTSFLNISPQLITRLLKFDDRFIIFENTFDLIRNQPLIGYGSLRLTELTTFDYSFHNSYLEILIRHGLLGMLIWLTLILPVRIWKFTFSGYLYVVAYFMIAALFNNIFKHPHMMMFYSVWLLHDQAIQQRLVFNGKPIKRRPVEPV